MSTDRRILPTRHLAERSVRFSEHLKSFSVVLLHGESVAARLESWLKRFGPVECVALGSFRAAVEYLLPLKSFTTRFIVLGLEDRSFLLCDMYGENCHVDAFAISRMTDCGAIGVVMQSERRELQVYEHGIMVREVQSLLDGDRWYYREEGDLQPFEDFAEYVSPKKRDRLHPEALRRYLQRYAGIAVPTWDQTSFSHIVGVQRSVHEIKTPIHEFSTQVDFS